MSFKDYLPATRRAVQNTADAVRGLSDQLSSLTEKLNNIYARIEQADTGINGHLDSVYARVEQADTGVNGHLDSVYARVEQADTGVNGHLAYESSSIHEQLKVQGLHSRLRFESLYAHEIGEDIKTARRAFFASIPPAEGDMRLVQTVNVQLLVELDKICRENGITYWLAWGALLGSLTRGGCIPWDDDIDVCMMREDVDRLFDIMRDNNYFQLTLVYDWHAMCRQVRFSSRQFLLPCFVDVCIWDWASSVDRSNDEYMRALRLRLMAELTEKAEDFNYWASREYLFAPGSGYVVQFAPVDAESQDPTMAAAESSKIEAFFSGYFDLARSKGILCKKEQAKAIAYGFDQIYDVPKRRTLWPRDMVFPVSCGYFEDKEVLIPHDAEAFTDECYSGWPYLPFDMLSHVHYDKNDFDWRSVELEMRSFLETRVNTHGHQ